MHTRSPLCLGLLALLACQPTTPVGPPVADSLAAAKLARFASCDELKGHVAAAWTEQLIDVIYAGDYGWAAGTDESMQAEDGGDGGGNGAPQDYSETNNQVQGVDEPDMVKTNGEFIYIVQDGELLVVDSWPAEEAELLATIPLEGWADSMFLHDDRLMVYSSVYDYGDAYGGYEPEWEDPYAVDLPEGWWSATRVSIYDVSDPANPQLARTMDLQGNTVAARMIGSDTYTVQYHHIDMPQELWDLAYSEIPVYIDYDAAEAAQDLARELARVILQPRVEAYLAGVHPSELLPGMADSLGAGQVDQLLDCTDLYRPTVVTSAAVMSVVHHDLAGSDDAPLSATGLLSDGWTVYANQDALYISQSNQWWWGWLPEDRARTHLHRFELDGPDVAYTGSGSVDGWLLNQFSLDEHDGYLRVATTDLTWWWWGGEDADEPANRITVLDTSGDLDTVGSIDGIAPGEQIFSARFTEDVGYLVTFEQVDPFFTLDLSDPFAPRVVGELKITGFSNYLHPIGDDHVLAVGMEATEEGWIEGFQVTLFDVSDFANPVAADRIMLGSDDWSWSESLYDHHAFTLHNGVLSLPVYTYDNSGDNFSGMWVLDVDTDAGSLSELGRVAHNDLVAQSECVWTGDDAPCTDDYYWAAWMRRSVIIEDALFSISNYGIKVTEHQDPEAVLTQVLFRPYGG